MSRVTPRVVQTSNLRPLLTRTRTCPGPESALFSSKRAPLLVRPHAFVFACPLRLQSAVRPTSVLGKLITAPRCSVSGLPEVDMGSIYDFTVKDIDGNDVELSKYRGKVLLIVNVASQCGLTSTNYKELAELHTKYKGQEFEILAFPCNQFGGQEPGSNEQIKNFACTRFKAEYPIFDKINVNGSQEAPLYKYLKAQKGGGWLLGDSIKWNFAKFLVDKNGNVVDRYAPTTPPSKIEKTINKSLNVS